MWSKLIAFMHALCSGKSKTDSVQHLLNAASSVVVIVLSTSEQVSALEVLTVWTAQTSSHSSSMC